MELYNYKNFIFTVQRHGNDKNGNPIFLVNIFKKDNIYNINWLFGKVDKKGNLRCKYYGNLPELVKKNIDDYIKKYK